MKKIIIALLFLFCTAGAFAETGALGHKWGEKLNRTFSEDNVVVFGNENFQEEIITEKKIILGEKIDVYFIFLNKELSSIAYKLPTKKTKELKKKLTLNNECSPSFGVEFLENCLYGSTDIISFLYETTLLTESDGTEFLISTSSDLNSWDGKASIYDYNDDTRVYIYQNKKDKGDAYVVYIPHQQDY